MHLHPRIYRGHCVCLTCTAWVTRSTVTCAALRPASIGCSKASLTVSTMPWTCSWEPSPTAFSSVSRAVSAGNPALGPWEVVVVPWAGLQSALRSISSTLAFNWKVERDTRVILWLAFEIISRVAHYMRNATFPMTMVTTLPVSMHINASQMKTAHSPLALRRQGWHTPLLARTPPPRDPCTPETGPPRGGCPANMAGGTAKKRGARSAIWSVSVWLATQLTTAQCRFRGGEFGRYGDSFCAKISVKKRLL